jgi:alpha-beta hydrolase superfamily lysophospholipase
VLSFDLFGHGHSGGKKGNHPGFEFLLDAVEQAIKQAEKRCPDLPLFLYGHSMGGNLVINYTLRRKHRLKGTVATSPFLELAFQPPAWKLGPAKAIRFIYPSFTTSNELETGALSKDPKEIEAYIKDPMIHDRVGPGYSLEFIRTGAWALEHASSLKTPLLLVHGKKDRITSSAASKEFAERAGGKATYIEIPNGFHELHHDLEKQQVLESICDWIEKTNNNNPK